MKIPFSKGKISTGILLFLITNMAQAGIPFFTFMPLIFLNIFTTMTQAGAPFLAFIPVMVMGPNISIPATGKKPITYQVATLSPSITRPKPGIKPVLTFIPLTSPNISVPANTSKTIKYKVTNLSIKPQKLILKPIRGIRQVITAGNCTSPFTLRYRQSCTLNLQINGNALPGNVVGGPLVCQQGSLRCHQPNQGHRLNIKLIKKIPPKVIPKYTVGGTVTGLTGDAVTLQLNGSNVTPIRVNGRFTFSIPIIQGKIYAVTVKTHPKNQTCKITRGSGIMNKIKVTHVLVSCSKKAEVRVIKPADESKVNSETKINKGNEHTELSPLAPSNSSETAGETEQKDKANISAMPLQSNEANNTGSAVAGAIPNAQNNSDRALVQNPPGEQDNVTSTITTNDTATELTQSVMSQQDNNGPDTDDASAGLMLAQNRLDTNIGEVPSEGQSDAGLSNLSASDAVNEMNTGESNITSNTTLATSIRNLALSVTGLTEHGLPEAPDSGLARVITITNRGEVEAEHLVVTPPMWPLNTTSSTTCGSTLAAGAHCTITVTPGPTATSDGTNPCSSGTTPIPGVIQVSADNAEPISINTVVLNYGCIYQGGYVYAFDDTTANTKSVGGKVVTIMDLTPANSTGVSWSPHIPREDIEDDWTLIDNSASTTSSSNTEGQAACDSSRDGACDSDYIHVHHQHNESEAPINRPNYAAGYCQQSIGGYDDWYLPAICEMGYGSDLCGDAAAPVLQNMQSNLVDFNNLNLLVGSYWSSTEDLNYPYDYAWRQNFAPGDDSSQFLIYKNVPLSVRCSRALTAEHIN